MKTILFPLLLFVIFATLTSSAFALENSLANREKEAERYLTVNSPQEIFQDIAELIQDSLPVEEQQTFIDMLTKHLDMDVLAQAMKESLVEHFTAEEIYALASFYSMPGSKSAMDKMGVYMSDVLPIIHDEMIKAQEKALESHKNDDGNTSKQTTTLQ